jgi:hypothetical protein
MNITNLKGIFQLRTLPIYVLLVASLGCTSNAADAKSGAAKPAATGSTATSAVAAFTDADLQGLEKGLAREAALVRAARERANNAKTPEERAKASQDEWEDQTISGGAQASGLSLDRYRNVRKTVNQVLETLDFQGKIDGPLEIDLEHAAPQMKQRLSSDPFATLPPSSASALRARLATLVPVWVNYMKLTALNG